jgi:hypothetical protein
MSLHGAVAGFFVLAYIYNLHLLSNFSDSSAILATPSSFATRAVFESTALELGHGSTKNDFALHLLLMAPPWMVQESSKGM